MSKYYTQDEVNELVLDFISVMCKKEYRDVSAYMKERARVNRKYVEDKNTR